MPVGGDDLETECVELGAERLESQHLLGPADALDAVAIDEPHDVGQPAMGNEQGRLPGAPLVELAVGGEAEEAPVASVENRPQGHPGAQREPVAQATRRERDLLYRVDRRKGRESCPLPVEGIELARVEGVRLGEQGIERRHSVALGENERVLVAHPRVLQKDQNLGA